MKTKFTGLTDKKLVKKMSTRATIQFKDKWGDTFYVYRHSDGFPEYIINDFNEVVKEYETTDLEDFVTCFIGKHYDYKGRGYSVYRITSEFHGDESYKYFVEFDDEKKEWYIKNIE